MELIDQLEKIIHKKFCLAVTNPGFFVLEDDDVTKPKKLPPTFVQYHSEKKFLPCKFDIKDSNNELFQAFEVSVKGVSSMCDYILLFEKREKKKITLFVFLCELKATKGSENKQLEAARIFAEFLVKTANRLLKFKPFNIEYRGLVFSNYQRTKFKTNLKNESYIKLEHSGLLQMRLRPGTNCILELLAK